VSRLYVPFWRINATVFSTYQRTSGGAVVFTESLPEPAEESPGAEVRIVSKEISFCADDSFTWAIESLGVRTQVLGLSPLDSEFYESNDVASMTIDIRQAKDRFEQTVRSTATAVSSAGRNIDMTVVALESALIYFPIWIVSFTNRSGRHVAQFDPLAKRVASMTDRELEIPLPENGRPIECDSIRIVPHRCPNCGCDLPESERSVTYYCATCMRLFRADGQKYRQLKMRIPSGLEKEYQLFPFWVFDLADAVWPEKCDLLQALSLIGFSHERFYVPAFNIVNPSRLLRLVSHYNRRDDTFVFENQLRNAYTFSDVTLSPEHAASMIVPLTVAVKTTKGYEAHDAPVTGQADVGHPELVWLPYALDQYFWREQITGAAIEKAAVKI